MRNSENSNAMIAGLEALKQAVPEQAGAIDQIITGIQAQQTAISQVAAGAGNLVTGANNLAIGAGNLSDSLRTLGAGATQVADGAASVQTGAETLSGALELLEQVQTSCSLVLEVWQLSLQQEPNSFQKELEHYLQEHRVSTQDLEH